MAAPLGNQNAVKAKRWSQAIDRALEKRSKGDGIKALDDLAEKLLVLAEGGDLGALKELGDRIEGKVAQAVELTGANGGPLEHTHGVSDATKGLLDQVRGGGNDTRTSLPMQD